MKSKINLQELKPSELIEVAISDLIKCEKNPEYKIEMGEWHHYNKQKEVCQVCLAGAVLAQTCNLPIDYNAIIDSKLIALHGPNEKVFDALDDFRTGRINSGFEELGLSREDGYNFDREIIEYVVDPHEFKAEMLQLSADLKAAGF